MHPAHAEVNEPRFRWGSNRQIVAAVGIALLSIVVLGALAFGVLIWGWLRMRSGNLFAPAFAHALNWVVNAGL